MYYGKMEEHKIAAPAKVEDEFHHFHDETSNKGSALIHIAVQDRTTLMHNDLQTYNTTLVGYTENEKIQKDWWIDGKYKVLSVVPHRHLNVLYLQEVDNG